MSLTCEARATNEADRLPLIPSRAERTLENTVAGDYELTEEEKAEIWKLVDGFEVKGDRYFGMDPKTSNLWG